MYIYRCYVHILCPKHLRIFSGFFKNDGYNKIFFKCVRTLLIQVLLVFTKEDSQCNGFYRACEKAGFKCTVTKEVQTVLACFQDKLHDIIIIDHRNPRQMDAEAMCR